MLGGPNLLRESEPPIGRPEQLYRLLRWLDQGEQGVLIALDDVHWADSDSLELCRCCPADRLTARSGHRDDALLAGRRSGGCLEPRRFWSGTPSATGATQSRGIHGDADRTG
jgi:hypothetical protein